MHPLAPVIADADMGSIVFVCIVLLVIVLAGAFGVVVLRKRIWGDDDDSGTGDGFSLGELRQLKKSGHISDQEFEKAKAMVVAAAQQRAKAIPDPKKPGKPA
jgi:hypothetical protein